MPDTRDSQGRHVVDYAVLSSPALEGKVHRHMRAHRDHRTGDWAMTFATVEDAVAYANSELSTVPWTVHRHYRRGYGTTHHVTTPAGSQIAIHAEVDGYGRGHSHAIYGTTRDGRSVTILRNVSKKGVIPAVLAAEAQGYTRISAGMEAF